MACRFFTLRFFRIVILKKKQKKTKTKKNQKKTKTKQTNKKKTTNKQKN